MKCLLIIAIALPAILLAQKNNIQFQIGLARRFATINIEDKGFTINTRNIFFNNIKQSKTLNLVIDISKKVLKEKFELQISNYWRYCHNHYRRNYSPTVYQEVKKIKTDLFADIICRLPIRKNKIAKCFLLLGGGFGQMNMNSQYSYDETIAIDSSGNPHKIHVQGSFEFLAPRIDIGVEIKKFRAFLVFHFTPDEDYQPYPTLWPEVKLTYQLFHFKL